MQRPDLFAAGLPAVGVMDMLRFNKFSSGRFWVADYGSPEPLPEQPQDWDPREFDNLLKISPYHMALRARTLKQSYPAILVTTSDHDDRVVPMHSYKFAAALQNAQAGAAPILIRIETNAGHGGGLPLSKRIQISADEISFIEAAMGLGVPGHP
jgi:prolyl oligopeptidase